MSSIFQRLGRALPERHAPGKNSFATEAKALRDWIDLCRIKPKMLPLKSLVPRFVTTLTIPPVARPNSGRYELVVT